MYHLKHTPSVHTLCPLGKPRSCFLGTSRISRSQFSSSISPARKSTLHLKSPFLVSLRCPLLVLHQLHHSIIQNFPMSLPTKSWFGTFTVFPRCGHAAIDPPITVSRARDTAVTTRVCRSCVPTVYHAGTPSDHSECPGDNPVGFFPRVHLRWSRVGPLRIPPVRFTQDGPGLVHLGYTGRVHSGFPAP